MQQLAVRKAWKGSGLAGTIFRTSATNLFVMTLSMLTSIVTARMFGVVGKGEFSAILLWPTLLAGIVSFGLPTSLIYNVKKHQGMEAALIRTGFLFQLPIAAATGAVAWSFMPVWMSGYPAEVVSAAKWYAVSMLPILLGINLLSALAQSMGRFQLYNGVRLYVPLLNLVGLLALWAAGNLSLTTAAAAFLATSAAVIAAALYRMRDTLRFDWPRGARRRIGEKRPRGGESAPERPVAGAAPVVGHTAVQSVAGEADDAGHTAVRPVAGEADDAGHAPVRSVAGEAYDAGHARGRPVAGEAPVVGHTAVRSVAGEADDAGHTPVQSVAGEAPVVGHAPELPAAELPHSRGKLWDRLAAKALLGYGSKVFGVELLGTVYAQFDKVVILSMLSARELGLYTVVYALSRVFNAVQTAIASVVFPKVTGQDNRVILATVSRAFRLSMLLMTVAAVPCMLIGRTLLGVLFGTPFLEAGSAFYILSAECIIGGGAWILASAFNAMGRPGLVLIRQIIALSATVGLFFLLVPAYGLNGIAAALLLGALIRLAVTLLAMRLAFGAGLGGLLYQSDDLRFLAESIKAKIRRKE